MLAAASHLLMEGEGCSSIAGRVALHVHGFSSRWLPIVEKALKGKVEGVDKEIQDLAGIVRWDMSNHHALKESVARSHRQLSKAIKRFDDTLQELADPILAVGTEQLEPIGEQTSIAVGLPRISSLLPATWSATNAEQALVRFELNSEESWKSMTSLQAALPSLFTSLTKIVAKGMIEDTFCFGAPEGCSAMDVVDDLRVEILELFQVLQDVDKPVLAKRRRLQGLKDDCASLGITPRPMARDALDVLTFFQREVSPRSPSGSMKIVSTAGSEELLSQPIEGNDAPPAKKPRMDDWQDGPRIDRSASFESRANVLWELAEARTYECMHLALRLHSFKSKPQDLNSADVQLWSGMAAGCLQAIQWHRQRCLEFHGQLAKFASLCTTHLLESTVLVPRSELEGTLQHVDCLLEGLLQAQTVIASTVGSAKASQLLPAIDALRAVVMDIQSKAEYALHFGRLHDKVSLPAFLRVRIKFINDLVTGVQEAMSTARGCIASALSSMPQAMDQGLQSILALLLKHVGTLQEHLVDHEATLVEASEHMDFAHVQPSALRELLVLVQASQQSLRQDPSLSSLAAKAAAPPDPEASEAEANDAASFPVPRLGIRRGDNLRSLMEVFPVDSLLAWLDRHTAELPSRSAKTWISPFARQTVGIGQVVMLSALEAHLAMADAASNLMKLVCLLLEKGLGTNTAEEEDGEDGQDGKTDWAQGTGMGEGDGVRDVTEEIEDDKQLEGMQNEKDKSQQEPPPMPEAGEEDKAREVGFDVDAEAQPQPEDQEQKNSEENEQDKEHDRQKGDVDLNQGGKLDEKLWNGEEDQDDGADDQDEKEKNKEQEKTEENIEAHGAKGEGEADNMAKEEEKDKKKGKDQEEESDLHGERQDGQDAAKDEGPVEPPPGCNPEEQESQFDVHMQPQTPPTGEGEGEGEHAEDMDLNFENLDEEEGGDGNDVPEPGELGAEDAEEEEGGDREQDQEERTEEGPPEAYAADSAGGEEPEPDQVDACVEGDSAQMEDAQEEPQEDNCGPSAQESAEAEDPSADGNKCQPDPESVSTSRDTQANAAKDQQVFGGAGGAPTPTEAGQQDGRDTAAEQNQQQKASAARQSEQGREDVAAASQPQAGEAGSQRQLDAPREDGGDKEDQGQRELKKVDVVQSEDVGDTPCGEQEDSSAQKGLHMADPKSGMEALAESTEPPAGENKAMGTAEDHHSGDEEPAMEENEETAANKEKAIAMESLRVEDGKEDSGNPHSELKPATQAEGSQGVDLAGDTDLGIPGITNAVTANLSALRSEGAADAKDELDAEGANQEDLGNHRQRPAEEVQQLWCHLEGSTGALAAALCEQLRAILEPTLKGRLQGHYRTGKRISMRRVIPFIASNYRRDKIWLRRTKPSKREYQVVVAIDNSRSMRECGVAPMALQTLCVVCQALARLEVGEYAVLAFGSLVPRVLLPLGANQPHAATFGWEQAKTVLSEFTFDEESSNSHNRSLADVMSASAQLFQERSASGPVRPFCQAMLIISDGRFNKAKVLPWVHAALARQQLPLLVVVDSVGGGEPTEGSSTAASSSMPKQAPRSIFELKAVSYDNGQCNVAPYLQDFPFPYYVVVQDLQALPMVLGEVLKQWFELAMGS